MGRHKTCPYIRRILCRGNPRGCPIVGRFSKIDDFVSSGFLVIPIYRGCESRPTQAQQTGDYPGGLEHKERRSPFPTNDSVLGPGKGFVLNNSRTLGTEDRCSIQLLQNVNRT